MMIMGFEGWLKGFTQVKFSTAQAFDKCLLTPVTSRQASLVKILAASGCQDASLHVISTEVLVHCSWQEPKPTLASQVQAWEAAPFPPVTPASPAPLDPRFHLRRGSQGPNKKAASLGESAALLRALAPVTPAGTLRPPPPHLFGLRAHVRLWRRVVQSSLS